MSKAMEFQEQLFITARMAEPAPKSVIPDGARANPKVGISHTEM